jgi:hypothetical protein
LVGNTNNGKKQHTTTSAPKTQPTGTAENRPHPYKKDNKIWTTFTYHSPKIRTITNMLNDTNCKRSIQYHHNDTSKHKTKKHTPTQNTKKQNIQNQMQYMPQGIYRANKP